MTASSEYDSNKPAYGRLNSTRGDGWCAKESKRNDDWLQVDLGKTMQLCAAATQGDRSGNEWVTDFKLSYSSDENTWITYQYGNGTELVRFINNYKMFVTYTSMATTTTEDDFGDNFDDDDDDDGSFNNTVL